MLTRIMIVTVSFLIFGFQLKSLQTKTTANFRIQYERNIPADGVRSISEMLESKLAHYRSKFGVTIYEKIDVYILNTVGRFRIESQSEMFDDGDFKLGNIYLVYQNPSEKKEKLNFVISRIMSRAMLFYLPGCPPWLAEAYSLYAGNEIGRFGDPVRMNLSGFSDLSEDYSRTSSKKESKELYARLSATVQFLINRYGEMRVEAMIKKFKDGGTLDQNFETTFSEKVSVIEKEWVKSLHTFRRGE